MKHINASVVVLFLALMISAKSHSHSVPADGAAAYLALTPPGAKSEEFPPAALISGGWQLGGDISADMDEFYMLNPNEIPHVPTVIVFRKENGVWKKHNFHAALSGNPDIIYNDAIYIERTETGWSKIKSLGPMFEREDWGIMRLSASANGTFVFDDWKNNDVIRISRIKDGKRQPPTLLGKHINTGKWTAHPFIAPDESYIIWDSEREEGFGRSDLYISFKQEDDSWGAAINLGENINTALVENGAMVTPDGKYLLFGRSEEKVNEDGSTYWVSQKQWVDAQVIENLRPKH